MGKYRGKMKKRVLAIVLSVAMTMSGMTSYASEPAPDTGEQIQVTSEENTGSGDEAESSEDGKETEGSLDSAEENSGENMEEVTKTPEGEEKSTDEESSAMESEGTEEVETETSTETETETETVTETETETETEVEIKKKASARSAEVYGDTDGDNQDYVVYNMEGYAASGNVTGGGLLKKGANDNYYAVSTEADFLQALIDIKASGAASVVEITDDMNLGSKEVADFSKYSSIIKASVEPLIHPILLNTGVSQLTLDGFNNLTIYSSNGSSILHCGIVVKNSSDIIIRNIVFDELWEWDDIANDKGEYGSYDRNDWDYLCIDENSDLVWVDHCTFYKAYDGIVDIKKPATGKEQRVTISWCAFLPGSEGNTFFDAQLDALESDKDNLAYYKELRVTEGLTKEQVRWYAYGQKKTHLFGQSDDDTSADRIRVTLANNYYKNSMDRLPRLRRGMVHEYNCVLDSQELYEQKKSGNDILSSKITSNGAISTCNGKVLLENCYIKGIQNPLNSGNGSSPTGYINAKDCLYYINGIPADLAPKKSGSGSGDVLITDVDEFRGELPYSDYIRYDASTLQDKLASDAGAGKLTLSEVQWEKTSYGTRTGNEGVGDKEDPIVSMDYASEGTINFKVSDSTVIDSTKGLIANGFAYHDASHGLKTTVNGATIELNLEKKANIEVESCQYNNSGKTMSAESGGKGLEIEISTDADPKYTLTAEAGKLTLTFEHQMYVHNIKIEYVEEISDNVSEGTINFKVSDSTVIDNTKGLIVKGFAYHDASHGIKTTVNGATIELNLEKKANIEVESCQYNNSGKTMSAESGGKSLEIEISTDADPKYTLTAEAGKLTLTFEHQMYVHNIKVEYVEEISDNVSEGTINFKVSDSTVIDNTKGLIAKGFAYHDASHGIKTTVNGATIELNLEKKANIEVESCQYNNSGKTMSAESGGKSLEIEISTDADPKYTLTAEAGKLTLTFEHQMYVHNIKIEYEKTDSSGDTEINNPVLESGDGKIDVWDFGAEQLDTKTYNNKLTVDIINSWYPGVAPGTSGTDLAGFEVKDSEGEIELKFDGGDATNHRLRTNNTALTRKDDKDLTYKGVKYNGYVYSNKAGSAVNLQLAVQAGDIVTLVVSSNGTNSTINFESPSGKADQKLYDTGDKDNTAIMTFYAAETGIYKIYSSEEKLVVARIYRERPSIVNVTGTVTVPADLTAKYVLSFTNQTTKAVTKAAVEAGKYEIELQECYQYTVGLIGADEYIVDTGKEIDLTDKTGEDRTNNIVIKGVELVTVGGSFDGIDTDALNDIEITLENTSRVYQPKLMVSNGTYTAKFEKGVSYTVNAVDKQGKYAIEDYVLKTQSVQADTDASDIDITFEKKTTYPITIVPGGDVKSLDDIKGAVFTFYYVDLEKEGIDKRNGYVYKFDDPDEIKLRDGAYEIEVGNSGTYVQQLTTNLKVEGKAVSKTINFKSGGAVEWDFTSDAFTGQSPFNGLTFTAGKKHSTKYGYCSTGSTGSTDIEMVIPVPGDCTVLVTGSFKWDFKFGEDGDSIQNLETEKKETFKYEYQGAAGTVTLYIGTDTTTYISKIEVMPAAEPVAFASTVKVGKDKEYKTINEALEAVSLMDRTAEDGSAKRVTIEIDPGDYEEMLVVDQPNITLKNASAAPSIALKDKGAGIDENAVRITWYYGHGYTYYSMGSDNKYHADILAANKENGYPSFENPGAGTTNNSYWNASVVISAGGFQAEGIIFENSFNQYVSAKCAEDILVKQSGAKEDESKPRADLKTVGDTTVQNKSYVERATAVAMTNNVEQVFFDNCSFVGRQDVVYGGTGTTAAFYDCDVYGAVDYIFGGMTAVFAKCDLVLNTSDTDGDIAYITAPQQKDTRGYLMYNCHVKSFTPGVDSASVNPAKPGGLGRAWEANTGEAVFYKTIIDATCTYWKASKGVSLITPQGWYSGLSAGSPLCTEYGTVEHSGIDNSAKRETTLGGGVLLEEKLADGSPITVAAFLGSWNPFEGKNMEIEIYEQAPEPGLEPDGEDTSVPATFWVVGDSTVSAFNDTYYIPRQGYGEQIATYFNAENTYNLAQSGASSKDYTTMKQYQTLLEGDANTPKLGDADTEGKFLIIGFGHNDQKAEDARYTNPNGDYKTEGSFAKSLYDNYIKPALDAGVTPVVATPIARLTDSNTLESYNSASGHITKDTTANGKTYAGGDYAQAIRDLCNTDELKDKVILADLTDATIKKNVELGEGAKWMHAFTAGEYNSDNTAIVPAVSSIDKTHTSVYGAKMNAWLIGSLTKDTALNKHFRNKAQPSYASSFGESVNPDYTVVDYTAPTEEEMANSMWPVYTDAAGRQWYGTVFGDTGGQNKITAKSDGTGGIVTTYFNSVIGEDNSLNLSVKGNAGKFAASTEGFIFYYTRLRAGTDFTLSAKALVNSFDANNQVSYGLMVRDEVYINKYISGTMGDFVAAGTLNQGKGNGFGRKSKARYNGPDIEGDNRYITAGDSPELMLSGTADGFSLKYGENPTVSAGFDYPLTAVDPRYIYVGFYVARNADITFTDIVLTAEESGPDDPEDPDNPVIKEVSAPEASIASGTAVQRGMKVSLMSATADAKIYYTTDGTEPTTSSTLYNSPITIGNDITIKAVAVLGAKASAVAVFSYTVPKDGEPGVTVKKQVSEPKASIGSDGRTTWLTRETKIKLSTSTTGAKIYYTTDGTRPTTDSALYDAKTQITVEKGRDTVIRAFAAADPDEYYDSAVVTFSYKFPTEDFGEIESDDIQELLDNYDNDTSKIPTGLWIAGIDRNGYEYTGTAVKPNVRVYYKTVLLREKTDYTISYKNNTNACTDTASAKVPTITVTGKGNYAGKNTALFKITPQNITGDGFDADNIAVTNPGKVKNQIPVLYWNGKALKKNKDYQIAKYYKSGSDEELDGVNSITEYGNYDIEITGTGNFTGSRRVVLTLANADNLTLMSSVAVDKIKNVSYEDYAANGVDVSASYKKKGGSKEELVEGTHYTLRFDNDKAAGTAYAILEGIETGGYTGTKRIAFKIVGTALGKAKVTENESAKFADRIYDGTEQELDLDVMLGDSPLIEDIDYKVSYSNNVNAGKAVVTITGINAYVGTIRKNFKIKAYDAGADEDGMIAVGVPTAEYMKGGAKPAPEVSYGGTTLKEGIDYTLAYKNNKKVAAAEGQNAPTVTVKFKGNFVKTVAKPFEITTKPLDKAILTIPAVAEKSTGKYSKSKPVLTDTDGTKLVAGKDYAKEITYTLADGSVYDEKNTTLAVGDIVKVMIKEVEGGAYTGTVEGTYQVVAKDKDIAKAKITILPKDYDANMPITPTEADFTVKLKNTELKEVTDGNTVYYYKILEGSYVNNVKKGTAKVTLIGSGNGYGGTKTVTFKINARSFTTNGWGWAWWNN